MVLLWAPRPQAGYWGIASQGAKHHEGVNYLPVSLDKIASLARPASIAIDERLNQQLTLIRRKRQQERQRWNFARSDGQ
jgi:hypothetical protein